MANKTYWIYRHGKPVHSVRLPEGATDEQVKAQAIHETNVVPGVVCDYPHEAPCEHHTKVAYGEVVR